VNISLDRKNSVEGTDALKMDPKLQALMARRRAVMNEIDEDSGYHNDYEGSTIQKRGGKSLVSKTSAVSAPVASELRPNALSSPAVTYECKDIRQTTYESTNSSLQAAHGTSAHAALAESNPHQSQFASDPSDVDMNEIEPTPQYVTSSQAVDLNTIDGLCSDDLCSQYTETFFDEMQIEQASPPSYLTPAHLDRTQACVFESMPSTTNRSLTSPTISPLPSTNVGPWAADLGLKFTSLSRSVSTGGVVVETNTALDSSGTRAIAGTKRGERGGGREESLFDHSREDGLYSIAEAGGRGGQENREYLQLKDSIKDTHTPLADTSVPLKSAVSGHIDSSTSMLLGQDTKRKAVPITVSIIVQRKCKYVYMHMYICV